MADPQFHASNPGQNPELARWLTNRIDGNAMRRLKIERESLEASLEATGLAQPATVLNFNPVPLVLDGGLANFKVPSVIDKFVKDADRIRVKFKGREFKASRLTIRKPRLYPQIKDVRKEEDVEVGEYDMKACKQIEIAHCFLTSYTYGTESSSGMGGVVVFEGDHNVLKGDSSTLNIKVPAYVLLPNRSREYFTKLKPFSEAVEEALELQRTYCNLQTQTAQSYWDNEQMRMNITDIHRVWHQYEMDMGWRQKEAPWVTLQNEPEEVCVGCGIPKKRVEAYFCQCGRPYDVLKAYMDGELPYTSDYMVRIADGDWTKVEAEEKRRAARRKRVEKRTAGGQAAEGEEA